MPDRRKLTFTRVVDAPQPLVFRAFTNAAALREWFCDVADVDAREGGRLYVYWHGGYYASGIYTDVQPHDFVAFTWRGRGEPSDTHVRVTLKRVERGTQIKVVHAGIGEGVGWGDVIDEFVRGWDSTLGNLESVLESGIDQRWTRRPFLGIQLGSGLSAAHAEKHEIPADEGVVVDETVIGSPAAKAGILRDDVLVRIDDQVLRTPRDFAVALSGFRMGDTVSVAWFHESEARQAEVILDPRPMPEIYETPAEWAEAKRQEYEHLNHEAARILEGISEEAAAFRPSEEERTVKEQLARLICMERDTQAWIASVLFDAGHAQFAADNNARIKGLLTIYPTLVELLEAMQKAQRETIAVIEAVPDDFLERKGSYVRLIQGTTFMKKLYLRTLEQIGKTIEAAEKH